MPSSFAENKESSIAPLQYVNVPILSNARFRGNISRALSASAINSSHASYLKDDWIHRESADLFDRYPGIPDSTELLGTSNDAEHSSFILPAASRSEQREFPRRESDLVSLNKDARLWNRATSAFLSGRTGLTNEAIPAHISSLLIASTHHDQSGIEQNLVGLLRAARLNANRFTLVTSHLVSDLQRIPDIAEQERALAAFEGTFTPLTPSEQVEAFHKLLSVTSALGPVASSIALMRIEAHLVNVIENSVNVVREHNARIACAP